MKTTTDDLVQHRIAEAVACVRRGWSLVPLKEKKPTLNNWTELPATTEEEARNYARRGNFGIRTGAISGVVVLDIDPRHGGTTDGLDLPITPVVETGGGGWHYYFRYPEGGLGNSASKLAPGVDSKGDGGQVVAVPSVHPDDGKTYRWAPGRSPADVPMADLPETILEKLRHGKPEHGAPSSGHDRIPEGQRNSVLTSLAGSMRRRGMSQEAIYAALCIVNRERCEPPLLDDEVHDIAQSVSRYQPTRDRQPEDKDGLTKELADAIMNTDFFAQNAGGRLYVYREGLYVPTGESHVRRRVKQLMNERGLTKQWSSHRALEVVEYIRVDAPNLWDQPPLDVLNLLNGLLNFTTRKLDPHTPNFLFPVQIPVNYDPDATCPEWEKFLSKVLPEDVVQAGVPWEITACLIHSGVAIQKAILFLGEGGNGKSTLLLALTNFLGRQNVVALSLHKLETDRFAVARLFGKSANICPDLPNTHLVSTSMFKAITGGDRITGEYKFKDSFEFLPYARLLFSANHPPQSGDDSEAFFQRWIVIPFYITFRGTPQEIHRSILDAKLADPNELSGVLNKALDVLPRVREQGITETSSMCETREEFRQTTDPLAVWLGQHTLELPDAFVAKGALQIAYNDACARQGRSPMTNQGFGRAIRRLRPSMEDGQRTVAGKVTDVWLGIGLKVPDSPKYHEKPMGDGNGGRSTATPSPDSGDQGVSGVSSTLYKDNQNREERGGGKEVEVGKTPETPETPEPLPYYPLIGHVVETPQGPGRLVQVFRDRVAVVLDSDPSRTVYMPPEAVKRYGTC